MDSEKLRISRAGFSEVLYTWLSAKISKKYVREHARILGFKIRNNEDFNKIRKELFAFFMWLICLNCEGAFVEDKDKLDECLDIFHIRAYKTYKGIKQDFAEWKKSKAIKEDFAGWIELMHAKYTEYYNAMAGKTTNLRALANLINMNIFGENKKDSLMDEMKTVIFIGETMKTSFEILGKEIKKYDIE
ncbi:MAG: hypothetical protein GY774_18910 [Planctomycetes bacterium]|nr:hypothetical protein [Planctomycetota bacterium]